MKRVLFLTNYASPYRVRFFDALGKAAQVTVLFSERTEEKTHRHADWFEKSSGHFQAVQLENRVASIRGKALCSDVIRWLKQPYDAIVICGYSSPTAMVAMAWLRLHRIPFYLEVDGGLIRQENWLKYRYKRLLVGGASYWLSTGEKTTEFLLHYGAQAGKIFVYPFTSLSASEVCTAPLTKEQKAELRQELGVTEGNMVLSIGQFVPRKGFDVLLDAAAKLPPDTGVYIVGGEPTQAYWDQIQRLGLTNIHFFGFQKKQRLVKFYKAADVFVFPTREDIWGLVVNEAMACGVPVVATDMCVAAQELIRDGVNGYVVPVDDPDAMAEKIKCLLAADRLAHAQAAVDTAQHYTIENMAKVHVDIFEGRVKP